MHKPYAITEGNLDIVQLGTRQFLIGHKTAPVKLDSPETVSSNHALCIFYPINYTVGSMQWLNPITSLTPQLKNPAPYFTMQCNAITFEPKPQF